MFSQLINNIDILLFFIKITILSGLFEFIDNYLSDKEIKNGVKVLFLRAFFSFLSIVMLRVTFQVYPLYNNV